VVKIEQQTDYPRSGKVRLTVTPETEAAFTLRIRHPAFSPSMRITVNGQVADTHEKDGFLLLDRRWPAAGEVVEVELDMPVTVTRAVIHDDRPSALVTYGPLVLAIDTRYGTPLGETKIAVTEETLPLIPAALTTDQWTPTLKHEPITCIAPAALPANNWTPIVCFQTPGTIAGVPAPVTLVDYASAGSAMPEVDRFQVWIPTE
jgi:hypothetical protein